MKVKKENHRVGRRPPAVKHVSVPVRQPSSNGSLLYKTARRMGVKLSAVLSRDAATSQHLQQTEQHAALSPIGLSDN